ncbi:hypothetical protein TRIUR3_12813 [Triticum urartu]|uniref:Uncharacterized protein n=1 Tax=Triticum urartu TaxID=4572 RepID=M7ZPP2_TRIUA|nr:hypothetical protein TRIUR3_12813 [Triticum urartu]
MARARRYTAHRSGHRGTRRRRAKTTMEARLHVEAHGGVRRRRSRRRSTTSRVKIKREIIGSNLDVCARGRIVQSWPGVDVGGRANAGRGHARSDGMCRAEGEGPKEDVVFAGIVRLGPSVRTCTV